ncbi:MAG: glutamine-hydrolyzing carbamoyl-phosphate synthase small subunit [Clostridia bacterium]|nr:glutamine-hydrolyzing carbamoyl-phosphate synthase small subunit [Clostridia bacterium]
MAGKMNKKLVLENGAEYCGYGFGAQDTSRVLEIVFNTSMVGYQEIVSDPTYTGAAVVMTYPLIGNYGIADEDYESKTPSVGALIVREYNDFPSNFRYTKTLSEYLEENGIPGIYGMDTRALTRAIRDGGVCKAVIVDADVPTEEAVATIKNTELSKNLVGEVTCTKRWYARTANAKFSVVVIDCGVKLSTVRTLNAMGCNVTMLPATASAHDVEMMQPDGVLISQGPGNPEDAGYVVELIKALRGKYPMFGIGLGHELIALAYGATTSKMKFGHHGCNHPVKNMATGKIETVAQNFLYAVDEESIAGTGLEITYKDILDGTVAGIASKAERVFTAAFDPNTTSGPEHRENLYEEFIALMKEGK